LPGKILVAEDFLGPLCLSLVEGITVIAMMFTPDIGVDLIYIAAQVTRLKDRSG
jgi:hypothetical protein